MSISGILFLKREVQDQNLISQCKSILDNWSSRIPFSPIKKLGTKTEFLSVREYAAYKTTVTTQIERRWLEDHDVPYRDQQLPGKLCPKLAVDPWKMPFKQFADFSEHKQSIDLFDTRQVYDCPRCNATGKVTCPRCNGAGEVTCGTCNGHGFNPCRRCSGRGKLRKTKSVPRQVNCNYCSGRGYTGSGSNERRCNSCGGKGTTIKNFEEEYEVTCDGCAGKGEVRCSTCHSSGKVTCPVCSGSGEVICSNCKGHKQMMSYVSAEQSEGPVTNEHQYIPPELPSFKKKDNPTSKISGETVFLEDEKLRIENPGFGGQEGATVLNAEVETCRQTHVGHVLRQQIKVECCPIVEYRYQFARKEYSIFTNPSQGLVEDISGPIQTAIEKMDALAQKAFDGKKYEDAYRLNLRSLCMDEATEDEKKLRGLIIKRLTNCYLMVAIFSWLLVSAAWFLIAATAFARPGNFGPFLGIVPLLAGVFCFARDFGLRLQKPSLRNLSAVMLGMAASMSGAAIGPESFDWNIANHWLDSMPIIFTTGGIIVLILFRAKERARRLAIEKAIKDFSNEQALEAYVCGLDPKSSFNSGVIFGVASVSLVLLCSSLGIAAYHKSTNPNIAENGDSSAVQNPVQQAANNQAAADKGDAEAQTRLGIQYAKGDGVPKDSMEAVKWFRQAAEQGFPRAQNNLGIMYDNGDGVPKDSAEAIKWFRKAAEQGFAQAQNNLGTMFSDGDDVEKDPAETSRWFRKAARQGLALAQNNLGLACAKGEGEPQNASEAVKWFSLAAKQGLARAQNNLGVMYDDGNGVDANPAEAAFWFTKAAEQGFREAQKNLGSMYQEGRGLAKDYVQAAKWFSLAASQGDDEAKDKYTEITDTMAQDQINRIQNLAKEFVPKIDVTN